MEFETEYFFASVKSGKYAIWIINVYNITRKLERMKIHEKNTNWFNFPSKVKIVKSKINSQLRDENEIELKYW